MLPLNRAVAARALSLVGTRFRPQGRRPEHGLDCVGMVGVAAGLPEKCLPGGYTLRRQASGDELGQTLGGLVEPICHHEAGEGDVLLVSAGAGQHHFLVITQGGFVHADARVGRVVARPGDVPWPAVAAWRVREQD